MKTSGTTVSATGHKGGLGDGLYDKAGARPDLDLDFAKTKSLKDRVSKEELITFTRASGTGYGATYVDENGLVKVAPINAVVNSEDLTHATYLLSGDGIFSSSGRGAISANAGTSPDGGIAGAIIGEGSSGRYTIGVRPAGGSSSYKLADNTQYVMSVFVKKLSGDSSERYVNLQTQQYSTWSHTGYSGVFDLDTGTRVTDPSNTNITSGIEDVGDGWYRIYFVSTTTTATTSTGFYINITDGTNTGYTTTQTSSQGLLIWGAQTEYGSVPTTYIPTTTQPSGAPRFTHDPETKESKGFLIEQQSTNYLKSSSNFNLALSYGGWAHATGGSPRVSYDNNIANPDGSMGAAYLNNNGVETYAFFDTTQYDADNDGTADGTDTVTISCFVKAKANETDELILQLYLSQSNTVSVNLGWVLRFDPNGNNGEGSLDMRNPSRTVNGSSVTLGTSSNPIIKKYQNGWFRIGCTVQVNPVTEGGVTYSTFQNNARLDIQAGADNNDGNDGKHYFWGPQVEVGSLLTSYIPTSGSTVTRSADLASIEGDNFGTYRKNLARNTDHLNFSLTSEPRWQYGDINQPFPLITYQIPNPIDGKYNAGLVDTSRIPSSRNRIKCTFDSNVGPANNYIFSAYVKPVGTECRIQFLTNKVHNKYVNFNLITNNITKGLSADFAEIQTVGSDGWKRIIWKPSNAVEWQAWNIALRTDSDTNGRNHIGTTDNKFYIYGPQVEEASAVTPYIPSTDKFTNRQSDATFVDGNGIIRTAKKNYLLYSEDISQWLTRGNGGSVTVTMDAAAVDPYGGLGVSKVQCSRTDLGHYQAQRHVAVNTGTAQPNVQSAWLKAATPSDVGKIVSVWQYDSGFILNDSHTLTADWVRYVSPVANAPNATVSEPVNYGQLNNVHGGPDQTSVNFYIWGTQMVTGTEAGDYVKTEATGTGPARYSHDPDTLTPTGLYLEPEATNIVRAATLRSGGVDGIRINSESDQAAGLNADGVLSPMGTTKNVCKVFLDGTETSTQAFRVHNNSNATYATQNKHTSSVFIKPSYVTKWRMAVSNNFASPTDGGDEAFMTTDFTLTGDGSISLINAGLAAAGTPTIKKYPNGWYRISITYFRSNHTGSDVVNRDAAVLVYPIINNYIGTDNAAGNVASVYSRIPFTQAEVQASPITFGYLFGPQAEDGVVATSYIPTINAEVDRTADNFTSTATEVLDRANGTKPAFYTPDGISIYAEAKYNAASHTNIANFSRILQLRKNTDNVVGLYKHNNQIQFIGPNNMFVQRGFNLGSGDLKIGTRYAKNDSRIYINFNQSLTNTQGTLDTDVPAEEKATDLYIGNNAIGSGFTNGTIKRLTFWKTPLPDSKLDKLTA